jgi:putative heme iron utilization protein
MNKGGNAFMNSQALGTLAALLHRRNVAALGTLQGTDPYVSMVPFAISPDGLALVIHVSRLAAHTQNLMSHDRVSLLVTESEESGKMAQSLARVTVQGQARGLPREDPDYPALRDAYLERFPDAAELFQFADFLLIRIDVQSARYVAGFAQAQTLTSAAFARAVRE